MIHSTDKDELSYLSCIFLHDGRAHARELQPVCLGTEIKFLREIN